jgi:hypothetical protein
MLTPIKKITRRIDQKIMLNTSLAVYIEKTSLALYGRRTVCGKYKFCKQENIDFRINIPQKTHANIGIGKVSRVLTVFEIMGGLRAYRYTLYSRQ